MSADRFLNEQTEQPPQFTEGPYWESFEQFRTVGAKHLPTQIGPEQIGRLNVKGQEFVVMRGTTFNRLYGLAQDAQRLGRGIRLLRQAVELALHTSDLKMAIMHLRDLTLFLPETTVEERPAARPLNFAPDEQTGEETDAADFELDPEKVRRAMRDTAR